MHITPRWKEHELYKAGKIEMIPTEWVWQYWGSDVSPMGDLMDGTLVTLEDLWESLQNEGMYNPLIMRVGVRDKKMRLESGNHRIQLFHKHGIEHIPVTVQVRDECGPHLDDVMTDATQTWDATDELLISEITDEYMKPSQVFKSFAPNL